MSKYITRWTMILSVLFLGSSITYAIVDFDSGGTEVFNYTTSDEVRVDYNVANWPGTHLIVEDGANISQRLSAYNNSQITMTDGTTDDLIAWGNSQITFTDNANASFVIATDNSNLCISGGTIKYSVEAYRNSNVYISGGNFTDSLYAIENGVITIAGTGFKVCGFGVTGGVSVSGYLDIPYLVSVGALRSYVGSDGIFHSYVGNLTGTLADGTVLYGNTIQINHRLSNGVFMGGANFNFVPEPASLLLLGIGALALRRKK